MGKPLISVELGNTPQAWEQMTSADNRTFSTSFTPWSGSVDLTTDIRPYGAATGGKVKPAVSGTDNAVDVEALTAYMVEGATANADGLVTVAADTDVVVTRGTTNPYKILSITVSDAGAIAVIAGTEGTAFSETRGAAGGPPFIPIDSVEIAQVRLSSLTAAPITTSEIYQPGGVPLERYDFPVFPTSDFANGTVTFSSPLPLIHTGGVAKKVYARGAVPVFADIPFTVGWSPAESTFNTTSTDTYDGPVSTSSATVGNATFTAQNLRDGITDAIMQAVGKQVWVRFKPDRDKSPYSLTLGKLARTRTYPASGSVSATFTLAAVQPTVDFAA